MWNALNRIVPCETRGNSASMRSSLCPMLLTASFLFPQLRGVIRSRDTDKLAGLSLQPWRPIRPQLFTAYSSHLHPPSQHEPRRNHWSFLHSEPTTPRSCLEMPPVHRPLSPVLGCSEFDQIDSWGYSIWNFFLSNSINRIFISYNIIYINSINIYYIL